MTALGITNERLAVCPGFAINNMAYGGFGYSKLAGKVDAFTSPKAAFPNDCNLRLTKFPRYAPLTVLHSAMPAHVHLIVAVCRPAKIANVILPRDPVLVCNLREVMRVRYERKRHESMPKLPPGNPVRAPKNKRDVAKLRPRPSKNNRSITNAGARSTPHSFLAAPTPDAAIVTDLVHRKSCDLPPHNGGIHGQ